MFDSFVFILLFFRFDGKGFRRGLRSIAPSVADVEVVAALLLLHVLPLPLPRLLLDPPIGANTVFTPGFFLKRRRVLELSGGACEADDDKPT